MHLSSGAAPGAPRPRAARSKSGGTEQPAVYNFFVQLYLFFEG